MDVCLRISKPVEKKKGSRNSPSFMEPEGSQESTTVLYSEPDASSPRLPTPFSQIHSNIIFLCTPRSYK
jgi:hypothetical protein